MAAYELRRVCTGHFKTLLSLLFFSAPNLRGRSLDRQKILQHVHLCREFIKLHQKVGACFLMLLSDTFLAISRITEVICLLYASIISCSVYFGSWRCIGSRPYRQQSSAVLARKCCGQTDGQNYRSISRLQFAVRRAVKNL